MAVAVAVVVAVADGYESLEKDGMVCWGDPFFGGLSQGNGVT